MLETTWFVLWGVLWAVYFVLDGYTLGVGTLLPFLAKTDNEKRTFYNATGPFWDGNQVWLITAGGVTFAAFPGTYAIMFSAMYSALLLLLFCLIFRGVTFEFRSKVEDPRWRKGWDAAKFLGSVLPALLLGVAFANIFRGIPINAEGVNEAGLFQLLNPYGLAGGILFVLLFTVHGALWLAVRMEGEMQRKAVNAATKVWPFLTIWAVVFLVYSSAATNLYANYLKYPFLIPVLLLPIIGLVLSRVFLGSGKYWPAWAFSAVTIAGCALFGVLGMYPALLPSSLNPEWSMTIANSASSPLTLKIMLGVVLVFVPIVIIYQIWVHKVFAADPVTEESLKYEEAY